MGWQFTGTDVIGVEPGTDPPWKEFDVSITTNNAVGPNGATDAHTLDRTSSVGSRSYRCDNSFSSPNAYRQYLWAQAGTLDNVSMGILDSDGWDLTDAAVLQGPGVASITNWANFTGLSTTEWSLLAVTANVLDNNLRDFYIYPGSPSAGFTGTIKIWKPRVVVGTGAADDWVFVPDAIGLDRAINRSINRSI